MGVRNLRAICPKALVLLVVTTAISLLVFAAATASAAPRKLCYADSHGAVFAKNTTCSVAEDVVEVVAKRRWSLQPYRVHVDGTWRCKPYLHGEWHDVVCRQGSKAAGIGVKP